MRFEGAYTALVTPFAADGSVDYGQLRALVEEQVAGGVAGVVPVGTSGESPTLTHKEHVDVIRARDVARAARSRAAAVESLVHGLDHQRMLPHAEIIVGAPHHHGAFAVR